MKRWIIQKLGGYPDIDSALDDVYEMNLAQKEEILTLAVSKLFNTVGPEDILRENATGQWIFEGKVLSNDQKKMIQQQFEAIVNMSAWKILQADIKYRVNKKMFSESTSTLDLTVGKLWLHTLNVFNTRIKNALRGTGHFNTESK